MICCWLVYGLLLVELCWVCDLWVVAGLSVGVCFAVGGWFVCW